MFEFKIQHRSSESAARSGLFVTPHGTIQTPIFMPVGTKGTVKSLDRDDLLEMDTNIILANTYHLAMRPGPELVKKMGGLHKWMNWPGPILTDSGGFQAFSLKDMVKITDEGVEFKSHINGEKHFFSPERAIEIQEALGADIIMAFDECVPAGTDEKRTNIAMERTHEWILRCMKAKTRNDQALFPIVQGGAFPHLREKSARFMADLDTPGIAIGGVSVGENTEKKFLAIDSAMPYLPEEKPRYLMGIGTPDDLIEAVLRGVDMFDCVLATRLARHGSFWDLDGRHDIGNAKYKEDPSPLCTWVPHSASQKYSKSYLHHLFKEKEMLGPRLMSLHNIAFLFQLMKEIRYHIEKGGLLEFKDKFLNRFLHDSNTSRSGTQL